MIKLIQLTDIHLPAKATDTVNDINVYSALYKVVDIINKINDIDCIIITGDMSNKGDFDSYISLDDALSKIKLPIYWLQGNHDFSEVMLQVSSRIKIKTEKCFIINKTKFILLQSVMRDEDNLSLNKGRGYLFNYEMSFLKRELEENNYDNCVIALHHPPVLSNSWADRRILDNRLEFIALLEQFPKVKVVLYGHQHIAQHTELNGITYISSPPTSFHYDPNGERFSLLNGKQGFGIITIDSKSSVEYEFIFID